MKIITGMHRSGTSLVAKLFFEAGAEMGDPDTFYRPDRWNPEGYFERTEVHEVNMPLLHGPFGRLSYFRLPSEKTILKRGRRRAERIDSVIGQYGDAVLKDPRFCLTLPAWRSRGEPIERVLICLRHPASVIGSLRKRNRATTRHALYLWREHNRRVVKSCQGLPTWYIEYARLLNPRTFDEEARDALSFFGIPTESAERTRLRERCVRPGMNHHPATEAECPFEVRELWDHLKSLHRRQFTVGTPE